MKNKPIVGQTLYSLNIGNAARHTEQKLTPVKVTKVGRKYFTCQTEGWRVGTQYYLNSWAEKTDYSPDSCIYLNQQEWEDDKESVRISKLIAHEFQYGRNPTLTLEQLRIIEKMIIDGQTL